jgi:hypothetical protein
VGTIIAPPPTVPDHNIITISPIMDEEINGIENDNGSSFLNMEIFNGVVNGVDVENNRDVTEAADHRQQQASHFINNNNISGIG